MSARQKVIIVMEMMTVDRLLHYVLYNKHVILV